jgi:hypothetical protein
MSFINTTSSAKPGPRDLSKSDGCGGALKTIEVLHQVRSVAALLPCVLATAVINAAFLLFGQTLYDSSIQQRYHITHIFGPITIAMNLACHYSDYEIYKRNDRPLSLRELSCISFYGLALMSLAILSSPRLYVRTIIGFEPFLAFQVLGTAQANALYPSLV